MKFSFALLLILILNSVSIAKSNTDSTSIGSIKVRIIGIENEEGKIAIALSNSREDYETHDTVFRAATASIKDGVAEHIFESIPYGEYAIKVYHDEDDDGEIDLSFLGIPTEDYGFSNNASGTFGPADYDDVKFELNKTILEIEIDID